MRIEECIICQGKGTIEENKCNYCDGAGEVSYDDYNYPFLETVKSKDFPDYNDPCAGCSNNPKNNPNASGNCCCSLPYMNRPTY